MDSGEVKAIQIMGWGILVDRVKNSLRDVDRLMLDTKTLPCSEEGLSEVVKEIEDKRESLEAELKEAEEKLEYWTNKGVKSVGIHGEKPVVDLRCVGDKNSG